MSDDTIVPDHDDPSMADTLAARGDTVELSVGAPLTREVPQRYRYLGEIGKGGLGRVWVALDEHVGRHIAVKELLTSQVEERRGTLTESDQRFLREARVTGQLEHPSIVPVYEIGQRSDGALYYTMRRVRGAPMSRAIASARTLEERLLLVPRFRDVCQAVAYAHSRGVIHRDLKPDNVMLGDFGETVVLDWGLAKITGTDDDADREQRLGEGLARLRAEDGARTLAGTAMGTPLYMPPEQALGQLSEVDERSDIYALGAVLYEILTGQPPFDGPNAMVIVARVIAEPLTPVRSLCTEAPAELAAIAEKALNKEKSARYASAAALATDVEAFMSGKRVDAYTYGAVELMRLFARRHRAAVIAAVVVLVALLASVVVVTTFYFREHDARLAEATAKTEAVEARRQAEASLELEARERRRALFHLAAAQLEKGRALAHEDRWAEARIFAAAALANNPGHDRSPLHVRGFASGEPGALPLRARAASLINMAASLPTLVLLSEERVSDEFEPLALTSAGSGALVAGSSSGRLQWVSLGSTRDRRTVAAHEGAVLSADFSADGRRVASAGADGIVKVYDAQTGNELGKRKLPGVHSLRAAPTGDGLAVATSDGLLSLFDLNTLEPRGPTVNLGVPFAITWSADARQLAVVLVSKRLILLDVQRGARRSVPATPLGWHAAEFSPDGAILATADWGKTITLWNAARLTREAVLSGHEAAVYSFGYSRDGRYLLSGGFDRRLVIWDLAKRTALLSLVAHDERIRRIERLPVGDRFATLSWDRSVKLWELSATTPPPSRRAHGDAVRSLARSRDGRQIVTGGADGVARVWDATSLEPGAVLTGHVEQVMATAFSPDGSAIVTGSADRSVALWDATTGQAVRRLVGHERTVTGVEFVQGGNTVVSADAGGTVRLWHAKTGELLRELRAHDGSCWGLAASVGGERFATAGRDKTIRMFDARGNEVARLVEHRDWTSGVAFSPAGDRLATSGKDAVALLWDTSSKRVLNRLRGHDSWVNRVAFSPDGSRVLTASDDRSLRIWDAKSGNVLLVLDAEHSVEAALLDEQRVVFGDGVELRAIPYSLSVLSADAEHLLQEAQRAIGRELDGLQLAAARRRAK